MWIVGEHRELLGVWHADPENEQRWNMVFRELKERGLKGVRYVVFGDHSGLVKDNDIHTGE